MAADGCFACRRCLPAGASARALPRNRVRCPAAPPHVRRPTTRLAALCCDRRPGTGIITTFLAQLLAAPALAALRMAGGDGDAAPAPLPPPCHPAFLAVDINSHAAAACILTARRHGVSTVVDVVVGDATRALERLCTVRRCCHAQHAVPNRNCMFVHPRADRRADRTVPPECGGRAAVQPALCAHRVPGDHRWRSGHRASVGRRRGWP